MKIDRLVGILAILLQQDRITAAELAEKFEVSLRTINRDINDLNLAGIPITAERGRNGGISVMEGFKIDRTLLSSDDMDAILSGLGSLDSVSENKRYRQLMDKLSPKHHDMMNADNHIIIDLSSWDKSTVSDKIALIKSAMENRETISFTYNSPNGESLRVIEPYHLIFQWSGWYVWGFCTMRNDWRMFKLTRITELVRTGEKCTDRDIPEYSCDKLLHTKGGVTAEVRFDKSVKWRIIDEFGTQLPRYDEEGNILLSFTWSDVPAFYQYILTFGDKAEIISPEEYREGFAGLLKDIEVKYGTTDL